MKTKFTILLIISMLTSMALFSQIGVIKDASTGGSGDDYITCLISMQGGAFMAGGQSISNASGNKSENSRGGTDYWIVKYSGLGLIEWDKTIGGFENDDLTAILQTTDGGYILGGSSYSDISGDKTTAGKGGYDYWIVKLDANVNIQWDKSIGGRFSEILGSIQQTTDGGYIIGGSSTSDSSGDKTENNKGDADYWIVKLDAAGNIQWDKTIGGKKSEQTGIVAQTSDGYIVGGRSLSGVSGDRTSSNRGGSDYWIVKLDAAGNIQWDKAYGSTNSDDLTVLQVTTDGGYILGGESTGGISGEKTEGSRGTYDYWIVKINAHGKIQWDKTIGGNQDEHLRAIKQTSGGGYILGGYSYSNASGDKTENSKGGYDEWIVTLSKNGKVIADKTIGTNMSDFCEAIIQTIPLGQVLLGGTSYGDISGDKLKPSKGGTDYWIAALGNLENENIMATDENSNMATGEKVAVTIYPNPAGNVITLSGIEANMLITITDINGKTLHQQNISSRTQVNISKLLPGTYILKYKEGSSYKSIQFIKS